MPTKVLISTDSAILHTGLAETTRLIFHTLMDKYPGEYEIKQIGLFHSNPVVQPRWEIFPTKLDKQPNGSVRLVESDKYGQETFPGVVQRVQPDIVFGFGDPWYIYHMCNNPLIKNYALVLYLTFDGTPYSDEADAPILKNADRIVSMSHFGKHIMQTCKPDLKNKDIDVIYSPADIERFRPYSEEEKKIFRERMLPPWMPKDAFVLSWVGRNQWRKQTWMPYKIISHLRKGNYFICSDCEKITPIDWDPAVCKNAIEGGSRLESHPGFEFNKCIHCGSSNVEKADPIEDIFLWQHMAPEATQVWRTDWMEKQFDVKPGRDIHYTPGFTRIKGIHPDIMPKLYNLWDCMLYLTGGEGFSLPSLESICCGLPVIYTDYSSHAEFLNAANAGIPVSGVLQPEIQSCIWRMIADVGQTIAAVRKLYFNRELAKELGQNGRAYASQFPPDVQAEKWHKIFQEVKMPLRKNIQSVYAQQI